MYTVFNEATKSRKPITASVLSPFCSQPNTVVVLSISLKEQSSSRSSEVNTAPAVLGALLGISLLLLAVVIAGWVCTCFMHKKDSWQAKEIPHYRTELLDASYEDEMIENPAYDCIEDGNCEEQVDKFFDNYCLSGYTVSTFEKIAGTDCTPPSQTRGQISLESIMQTTTDETSGSESIVTALGALLGLSMLLLALVTIGWIRTCVSMKKREKSDNSEMIESTEQNRTTSQSVHKSKKDENDDDDEERYFKNPTYEGTSNKNNTSSATYETVNLSDSTKITIERNRHMLYQINSGKQMVLIFSKADRT